MAEVEYSTTAKLSVESIWEFIHDMDNWAPFLTGYQSHTKENDDDSEWILKGDVGSLTRTLKFKVHVTEWAAPSRVTFELHGVNEAMEGAGEFHMEPFEDDSAVAETEGANAADAPPSPKGFFSRLFEGILRFFFKQVHGEAERGEDADSGPGAGMAKLSFKLRLDPGGPMAPMINAMMKPAMMVAAEDLANKIIGHLENERDNRS